MKKFMIYGATGYTGRLAAQLAADRGMRPILGGRDREKLQSLARGLGLEYRVAGLDDGAALDELLHDVEAVLHVAGPYVFTLDPMVESCLRTGTHYVDLAGDIDDFEKLRARDGEAKKKGIMLLTAAGFDVVPTDCLASYVAAKVPGATRLTTFVSGFDNLSRGTQKTGIHSLGRGLQMRKNGDITPIDSIDMQWCDFGRGEVRCLPFTWGDISISYYTTGIPTIRTYHEATPTIRRAVHLVHYWGWLYGIGFMKRFVMKTASLLPEGPSEEYRQSATSVFIARAENEEGDSASARLFAPEGYTLTALTSLGIIEKVLSGRYESGFQTPAGVYGCDYILEIEGTRREDLI